jgi:hypothetical protein
MAAEQQRLQDEVSNLTAQVAQLVADVQQKTADAANQIAAEGQRLANDAQQLAADAAGLPDKAMALAEDARHQLDSLVEQNASLIGLLTHALVFFKEHFFKPENRLQVATYTPEQNAKPGIGLTWVDGQTKFLLAFAPEHPGPNGSIVVRAAGANGAPVVIPAVPVILSISGAGDQETIISLDSGAVPAGNADITVSLALGQATHTWEASLGHASPGTPTAEVHVQAKDGKWSYRISAKLQGVELLLRLGAVLGPVAEVVPIPEYTESRTFTVALEDGVFGFTEEAAS